MLVLMSPSTPAACIEPATERENRAATEPPSICGVLVEMSMTEEGVGEITILALMSPLTAAAWIAPATEREKCAATERAAGAGGAGGGGGATRGWQRRSTHQLAVWYPSRRAASRASLSGYFVDVSVIRQYTIKTRRLTTGIAKFHGTPSIGTNFGSSSQWISRLRLMSLRIYRRIARGW